jgi:hypothetical protein
VIDLVSRQVIYTAAGPFLGWANGDTFLIDGNQKYGALTVRPSLISGDATGGGGPRKEAQDRPSDVLGLSAPGSCHACASWSDSPMTLDLDNGIVAFPDTFNGGTGDVYELASGFKACCARRMPTPFLPARLQRCRREAQAVRGVRPTRCGRRVAGAAGTCAMAWPSATSMIPRRPEARYADQEWYKAAIPFARARPAPRARTQAQSTRIAGLTKASCCAATGARARGARRSAREASSREGLLTELSRFGVDAAPRLAREAIPFSNSPLGEGARRRYDADNKKLEPRSIGAARRSSGACSPTFPRSSPSRQRKLGVLPDVPL